MLSVATFPLPQPKSTRAPHRSGTSTDSFDLSALLEPIDLWGWKGLTIVGTGIRTGLQTTPEAKICIEQASKVLYLVADPVSEAWLKNLNPTAESLFSLYQSGKPRPQTYSEIVEKILDALRIASDVCVVFYGHPGMLVNPSREAMKRARAAGFQVRMLPGVSALDNLFSDLGFDPGITGLQSYEATGFLLHKPRFEPTAVLILWQIGVIGEMLWSPHSQPKAGNLRLLRDHLLMSYPADHLVAVYEAAVLPFERPVVHCTTLSKLLTSRMSTASTLFIPPLPRADPDPEIVNLLHAGGTPESRIHD